MEALLARGPCPQEQRPVSMVSTFPGAWEEGREERSRRAGAPGPAPRVPGPWCQMTLPTTTPPTEGPPPDHAPDGPARRAAPAPGLESRPWLHG